MRRLAPVFSALVSTLLGASAVAACSISDGTTADSDGGAPDGGDYSAPTCDAASLLGALTTSEPYDYMELRYEVVTSLGDGGGAPDAGPPALEIRAKKGALCGNATDKARCLEAYAGIGTRFGFPCNAQFGQCSVESLVVNQGDTFRSFHKLNAVGPFLAPVDSPSEAALVARLQGYGALCDATTPSASPGGGYVVRAVNGPPCSSKYGYTLDVSASGVVTEKSKVLVSPPVGVCGRRPEGLREVHTFAGLTSAGRFFAQCTHLEEASVPAFRTLERELRALGAGPKLLAAARRAARDEIRHTTMMRSLAKAFGGECAEVAVESPSPRSVLAMALENAREGCVGETYGAAQAAFQARRASDPRVRATLAVIARDEARHAELAWAVDAFLAPRLTAEERREVERAREEAWAALEASLRDEPSDELRDVAGLPNAREAAWLVAGVRDVLAAA
ncbi:MAG: ferritin-like domain-containing protein [Myxococcales bacterium]|nr:ferritin-like domain-containing protein [Myxococcales bacterium]